jgi:flavodoxin
MSPLLIVYFSRSGFTLAIAEAIRRQCGGELERIEEGRSRSGILGYLRSAREALRGAAVEIRPGTLRPRDFGLVVLGTPVWAGHVSSPMRAYLNAHRGELGRVAFFCTLGGSGASKVFAEMTALCQHEPIATLAVTDADIERDRYGGAVKDFAAAVGARASPPAS